MIQAIIATIVEVVALIFALSAGAILEEKKEHYHEKAGFCILISLALAACALGVAAR